MIHSPDGFPLLCLTFVEYTGLLFHGFAVDASALIADLMCWVGQPSNIYRSGPSAEPFPNHSTPEYLSGVGRMPKLLGALLEIGNQLFVCVVPVGRHELGVLGSFWSVSIVTLKPRLRYSSTYRQMYSAQRFQ